MTGYPCKFILMTTMQQCMRTSLGKNEIWYIVDTKPGARGLKEGVTKESFARAIKENCVEECLLDIEVKPGDVINIPAGFVHAIGS
jgi:mannose-6-phosphate isomerase